ncbi:MAG: hypothetical protein H8K03_01175 [Nitrospira sp.]
MPRRTELQPTESDNDPYQIGAEIANAAQMLDDRRSAEYDGVIGSLPPWIPDNFVKEFRATGDRLLQTGYTAKQIRDLMAQEMRRYRYAVRNPEKPISYGGFLWPPAVGKDVSFLAHLKTAVRLGPEEGLAFLTDETHAKKVNKGERYAKHQSRNAKHPRGKIAKDGPTISQIIGRLALRQDEQAKDLWNALHGDLDVLELNPGYGPTGDIEYDFQEGRKSMTFGTFEKTVSQYRSGRKKLP